MKGAWVGREVVGGGCGGGAVVRVVLAGPVGGRERVCGGGFRRGPEGGC